MSPPESDRFGPPEWTITILTGLWLLTWRWLCATPWGFAPTPSAGGMLNVGILTNAGDTWSYLSWVQQYAHGALRAGLIYTTEAHRALLWLFPLWLIGKIAAWTGLSVLGTYNAAGVIGGMVAVGLFLRAASALQLPPSARHWAAVAFVTGSGGSWAWHLAHKLGWATVANGGDLAFLDLFPSTTLLAYAYHAVGLALLAGLWWTTTEWENRQLAGRPGPSWGLATAGLALLLGFSRPYEPIAFLGAWSIKTAWHFTRRKTVPAEWRTSRIIAAVLGAALVPGIGWTVWVSTQPVWSTFASQSLALGLDRTAWLWTLVGWMILAGLGLGPAWQSDPRRTILPAAASALLAFVLLGLGSAQTKLASGLLLGPLLLAGWGAARIVTLTGRLPVFIRIGAVGLTLAALFGTASFFMNIQIFKLTGPALVEADLVTLAREVPVVKGSRLPVVLTDPETGAVLPGLIGARVWVGHWALSGHYKLKVARMRAAGLDPEFRPKQVGRQRENRAAILADARFDYALIDGRCRDALNDLTGRGWVRVDTRGRWNLLKAPMPRP